MYAAVQPYLGQHLYLVVFVVAVIDATGIPFPGRLLLVMAGAVSARHGDLVLTILMAAAGALAGDHLVYGLARLGGERVQRLYCRWTMTEGRCLPKTQEYFERFGPATILLGRFAFSVRLVAALLAGSGAMSYGRFVALDTLGALVWAALLVLLGRFLGTRSLAVVETYGGMEILLVAAAVGMLAVGAYRLWGRVRTRSALQAPRPGRPGCGSTRSPSGRCGP